MAKEDVQELPKEVPKKRKELQERTLDLHIAMWLASDSITPSERRRLEEEKARRKQLTPKNRLGILTDRAGVTPIQVEKIKELLPSEKDLEVVRASRTLPLGLKDTRYWITEESKSIVKEVDQVIACPQNDRRDSECWEAVKYAKHRSIPVVVVLPNGSIEGGLNG